MTEPSAEAYAMAWEQVRSMLTPTERLAMDEILRACSYQGEWFDQLSKLFKVEHFRGALR